MGGTLRKLRQTDVPSDPTPTRPTPPHRTTLHPNPNPSPRPIPTQPEAQLKPVPSSPPPFRHSRSDTALPHPSPHPPHLLAHVRLRLQLLHFLGHAVEGRSGRPSAHPSEHVIHLQWLCTGVGWDGTGGVGWVGWATMIAAIHTRNMGDSTLVAALAVLARAMT